MKILEMLFGRWYHIPGVKVIVEVVFVILPLAFTIRTFGFGLYQVPSGSMETTLLAGERLFADKFTYWLRGPKRGEIIAFNAPDQSVCERGYKYSDNSAFNWFERYVWGPENWTKRVIGLPGDHVQGAIEDGHPVVFLNGAKLNENSYVNHYPLMAVWQHGASRAQQREWNLKTIDPSVSLDKQPFYKIDPVDVIMSPQSKEPLIVQPGTPLTDGRDVFDIKLGQNQYWVMGDNRLGSADSREWGPLDGKLIHGKIVFRLWSMDTPETWWLLDLMKHPIHFWNHIRWDRCLQFIT